MAGLFANGRIPFVGPLAAHLGTPLFRNAYALMVNTGATAALGMVYWVLAARLYPPSDVGLAAAAISAMTFLASVGQLNLAAVMVRFLPLAGRSAARLVASSYLAISLTSFLIAGLFVLSLDHWFTSLRFLASDRVLSAWFVLATVCWCIFVNQDGVLTGLRRAVWVPVANIGYSAVKIVLLVALASFAYVGIFASWTLSVVVVLIPVNLLIFLRFIPQHVRDSPATATNLGLGHLRGYIAADYLGTMLRQSSTLLPPVIVTQILGPQENAYFYQCWIIAYSLQLLSAAAMTSLTVEAVWDVSKLRVLSVSILKHALGLVGLGALALVLVGPFILRVFGQDYADEGTTLLRLLALAAIPQCIVTFSLALARIRQRMAEVVAIQAASAAFVLGPGLLLVQSVGLIGIGFAWLVGQSVLALVLAIRLRGLFAADLAVAA